MKYIFLLLAAWFGLNAPQNNNTVLTGKVTDDKGEALIGAAVKILRGTDVVLGHVTDYNGEYRVSLDPGTYDVEFSYTGYVSARIVDVKVLADQINTLNAILTEGTVLSEVVVTSYKVPLIEADKTMSGTTLTSETITPRSRATSDARKKERAATAGKAGAPAMAPAPTGPATPVGADGGTRTEPTGYYIDGIRVTGAPPPVVDVAGVGAGGEKPFSAPATTPTEPPAPGDFVEVDGVRRQVVITFDPETYEEKVMVVDDSPTEVRDEETREAAKDEDVRETPDTPTQPTPRAGLLTAGEWNDLHNWSKHWTDLLGDGEIEPYQTMYQFYPKNRYAVLLQNEQGFPVADAEVKLLDRSGTLLWEARTDNLGRAELWTGMFDNKPAAGGLSLVAFVDGQKYKFPTAKPFAEGLNQLKINRACSAPKNVDIVWAVDATGSMGDEIEYLKTELLDVIGRVQGANPDLAVRMGTVFYRDKGDEYLVKSSALSPDIRQTVDYIQKQYANGGGDYPEAVDAALEEAIFRQPWSADAVTRICFLVLDASPHQEPEVIASLQRSIREAARRGIRIVPISASGIQKDTEFLMKFFGVATNGSYVFLTDHSGIGGKHIEPTTDEYKVELLNDLLVRLITEYATVETCEGKSPIRFEDPQAQNQQGQNPQNPGWQAFYYPNPASSQFTLELPFAVQKVTLYDAEGRAVRNLEKPHEGANVVIVSDLAEGFYTLRILKDGRMQSGKVMVVRS